jgi:hypothetical protein
MRWDVSISSVLQAMPVIPEEQDSKPAIMRGNGNVEAQHAADLYQRRLGCTAILDNGKTKGWDQLEAERDRQVVELEVELYAEELELDVDDLVNDDGDDNSVEDPVDANINNAIAVQEDDPIEVHGSDGDDTDSDSHVS